MKSKRKFLSIFAILFALVFALSVCFFAACGKKDDDEKDDDTTTEQDETTGSTDETEGGESESGDTATVTDVTVTPTTLSLVIGETDTGTLTASVTMSDGSYDGTYVWTSSNESVATVSESATATATVTAVAVGTAEITVTAGEKSATCAVTVSEPEPIVTTVTTADELTTALSGGGAIELGADIVGMFTVSADTTLDLAGHSITDKTDTEVAAIAEEEEETTQYTVTVAAGASLTVKDTSDTAAGSIVCTYAPTAKTGISANEDSREGAAIYTCGTLNIVGGTVKSSSVGILAEGGTATITGGTISTEYYTIFEAHGTVEVNVGGDAVVTGTRGIYVGGDAYYGYGLASETNSWANEADCTLNIYGDAQISTTFGSAISTLGYTGMNTAKINISGGTISGRPVEYESEDAETEKVTVMPAIYLPNGILNISGGTIEGTTAIEVRGGTATITGGTIKTTAETTNSPAWNGSGATSYGYAVAVYSYENVERPDTQEYIDNTLDVKISGGTIDGPLCETWKDGASVPEYTFSVTGGTFTEDPTDYVSEVGYVVIGYTDAGSVAEETDTVAYYSVVFDESIFAVYFDFTGDTYSEILSETRTHVEGGVAVDEGGIFTVISEVSSEKEKVAIKNGGLNFGGDASSNVNVTLNLSSFNGKNITICYTAYNNDGTKALTTCINSSASTTGGLHSISLAGDKTVGTLTYTVDITEGNQTLYIASDNKVVMLTFWILVNGETQTET